MSKNDRHISKPRWLDKSRAAWRRDCERDPSLPPLLSTAGKVEVKGGAVRVTLPIVRGKAVYIAVPVGGWRFELTSFEFSGRAEPVAPTIVPPAATVDQAKPDYDALFDLCVDLERRLCASREVLAGLQRRMSAFEANHLHNNNVIHLNSVAAE